VDNPGLMKICRGCGGRVPKSIVDTCPLCDGSKGFLLDGGVIEKSTNVENIEKPQSTLNESEELDRLRKENTELKNKLKSFEIIRKEVKKKQDESSKPKKKEEKKKSNIELAKEYNQKKYPERKSKKKKPKKKVKKKSNIKLAKEYNQERYGI